MADWLLSWLISAIFLVFALCQTSFYHWTRLWTINKHISGTLCFICSGKLFQYFYAWNRQVLFQSLAKENYLWSVSSPGYGYFFIYRQIAQHGILFYYLCTICIIDYYQSQNELTTFSQQRRFSLNGLYLQYKRNFFVIRCGL